MFEHILYVAGMILGIIFLSMYCYLKGWDQGYDYRKTEQRIEELEKLLESKKHES